MQKLKDMAETPGEMSQTVMQFLRGRWFATRLAPLLWHIICLFLFVGANSQTIGAGPSTNFSFPMFPSADDHLMTCGDVQYNPDNLSFVINSQRRKTGAKLLFADRVRMKNRDSSAVASFSTSFTFSTTQQEHSTNKSGWLQWASGLSFIFISESFSSLLLGFVEKTTLEDADVFDDSTASRFFGVEFDTYNSYTNEDPSDNHIGVNLNNIKSAYSYNLCGGNTTNCSFPWTGRAYTTWIEYNGSTRSLEVWFANGSMADGVTKPTGSGLIKVLELDLMGVSEDYMYVGIAGCTGPYGETHEILSWNFASSFMQEVPSPTPMPPAPSKRRHFSSVTFILDIIFASGAAVILLAIYLVRRYRGRDLLTNQFEPESNLHMGPRRFTFKELKKATKNFSENALLGKGGFGFVYKGTLSPSGMVVAVKRLTHDSKHVERDFLAEVSSIGQIRHRHLVKLLGWCVEDGHYLLVFDYMSKGSLDEWLFPLSPKYEKFEVLHWKLRFSILAGVAAALEYLHEDWVQCVLHRDIKSSNVLLDEDFNPHLGDFGLARLIDHEKLEKTTMMAGTLGYMAPEMYYTGKATKRSDVYSYGILILEVVCGRRPINLKVEDPDENFLLLQSVRRAQEAGNILSVVDPRLLNLQFHHLRAPNCSTATSDHIAIFLNSTRESEEVNELCPNTFPVVKTDATLNFGEERRIMHLLQLGLQCCLSDPKSRPSMRVVKQVLMQLQAISAEDALNFMPPLPSTMPVYNVSLLGSSLQAPKSSVEAMKVPHGVAEAPIIPRSDNLSGMRRRVQSS